jgi:DNA uptake protein ComE-like DNA-binding protein
MPRVPRKKSSNVWLPSGEASKSRDSKSSATKAKKPAARRRSSKNPWLVPGASPRKPKPVAKPSPSRTANGRRASAGSATGALDINDATFEQLREIGLSSQHTARVLEHRRLNGSFNSMSDLKKLRGVPGRTLDQLADKLRFS